MVWATLGKNYMLFKGCIPSFILQFLCNAKGEKDGKTFTFQEGICTLFEIWQSSVV